MFMTSTMTSITMMAAAAISSNPSRGFRAQSAITIGRAVNRSWSWLEVEQALLAGEQPGDGADQDQRRRLAEGPGQREHGAGDDPGQRRRAAPGVRMTSQRVAPTP